LSDILEKPSNRKLAAYYTPRELPDNYFTKKGLTSVKQKEEFFSSFVDEFSREVESCSGSDRMFISSEHLHSRLRDICSIQDMGILLHDLFSEIRIICYFREQSAVVKSLYSTVAKGDYKKSFESLLASCNPENHYYNYYEFFKKWSSVFGKENLIPRIFKRELFFENDIRKDVLNIIDRDFPPDFYDFSIDNRNTSLGSLGIELSRINNRVNKRNYHTSQNDFRNQTRDRISRVITRNKLSTIGELPFSSAADIYKKFEDSNIRFAKEFLDSDSNPFAPPEMATADSIEDKRLADDPVFAKFLTFFEDLLVEINKLPLVDGSYAETLKHLALRIEKGERLNLKDAETLMEIAHQIRPEGSFISKKLMAYRQKLEEENK